MMADHNGPEAPRSVSERMKQFSIGEGKRGGVPVARTVKFSSEVLERSYGGTNTQGHMKDSSILEASVSSTSSNIRLNVNMCLPTQPPKKTSPRKQNAPSGCTPRRKSENIIKKSELPGTPVQASRPGNNIRTPLRTPVQRRLTDQGVGVVSTPECFYNVGFETPQARRSPPRLQGKRQSMDEEDKDSEDSSSVTVAVRVRPFNSREKFEPDSHCVVTMNGNETTVTTDKGEPHRFTYDHSFWSFDEKLGDFASQEFVYESLAQPILGKAFDGYNTCLFAYGQTGSGKSYSIMGGHGDEEPGIIPRFCEEIFLRIQSVTETNKNVTVEISFFEIYNEKIHDLLAPGSVSASSRKDAKKHTLKVREHPSMGPYVEGLSSHGVTSFEDIQSWLSVGNKHRATATTAMNDKSSRSHSVFTLLLTQTQVESLGGAEHGHATTSRINIVDLAGSERQSLAKTSGERLREGASINKSLMALGKVIYLLSERSVSSNKRKKFFIPYRDSVLTWLLRESLGGNSKTAMLATISPALVHLEETLSTLRYANQARSIINMARVNEDPNARLVKDLRAEIERLRSQMGVMGDEDNVDMLAKMRKQLAEKELQIDEMARSWQERLKKSEESRKEESLLLERSGIAFQQVDSKVPYLVNLNEDPQLAELLLYVLNTGETHIGHVNATSHLDVRLNGPLIAERHCTFSYKNNRVNITPVQDAPTFVNGEPITATTSLHHADRIVLGGHHYFRLNHPGDQKSNGTHTTGSQDFLFAHDELVAGQNRRLEEAKQEIAAELSRTKQEASKEMSLARSSYEDKITSMKSKLGEAQVRQDEAETQCRDLEMQLKLMQEDKQMLERRLSARKKMVDEEAEVVIVPPVKSNLLEELERCSKELQEKVKDQDRCNQLAVNALPAAGRTHSIHRQVNQSRLYMMLREANKISENLHAKTELSQLDVPSTGDSGSLVRVTNNKHGVSTLWTYDVFYERLLCMRELYQGGQNVTSTEVDNVFFNPTDHWEQSDKLQDASRLSPRMAYSLRRQTLASNPVPKLNLNTDNVRTSGSSRPSDTTLRETSSLLGYCQDAISTTLIHCHTLQTSPGLSESVSDSCDVVRSCLNQLTSASSHDSTRDTITTFTTHIQFLLTTSAFYASSLATDGHEVEECVEELGGAAVRFLQGIENGVSSMRRQGSTAISSHLDRLSSLLNTSMSE